MKVENKLWFNRKTRDKTWENVLKFFPSINSLPNSKYDIYFANHLLGQQWCFDIPYIKGTAIIMFLVWFFLPVWIFFTNIYLIFGFFFYIVIITKIRKKTSFFDLKFNLKNKNISKDEILQNEKLYIKTKNCDYKIIDKETGKVYINGCQEIEKLKDGMIYFVLYRWVKPSGITSPITTIIQFAGKVMGTDKNKFVSHIGIARKEIIKQSNNEKGWRIYDLEGEGKQSNFEKQIKENKNLILYFFEIPFNITSAKGLYELFCYTTSEFSNADARVNAAKMLKHNFSNSVLKARLPETNNNGEIIKYNKFINNKVLTFCAKILKILEVKESKVCLDFILKDILLQMLKLRNNQNYIKSFDWSDEFCYLLEKELEFNIKEFWVWDFWLLLMEIDTYLINQGKKTGFNRDLYAIVCGK